MVQKRQRLPAHVCTEPHGKLTQLCRPELVGYSVLLQAGSCVASRVQQDAECCEMGQCGHANSTLKHP